MYMYVIYIYLCIMYIFMLAIFAEVSLVAAVSLIFLRSLSEEHLRPKGIQRFSGNSSDFPGGFPGGFMGFNNRI